MKFKLVHWCWWSSVGEWVEYIIGKIMKWPFVLFWCCSLKTRKSKPNIIQMPCCFGNTAARPQQFWWTACRGHCASTNWMWETHAVCSRVQSSRGCTCTPHHRHCTGLRCDSYTSSDNLGPSVQKDRLQTPETQSKLMNPYKPCSLCSTHTYIKHITHMFLSKCLDILHTYIVYSTELKKC